MTPHAIRLVAGMMNAGKDKGVMLKAAERIAELEQALQNIANGDTPWLDGYSETPGECYQKYAAYVLGKEIEK